MLCSRTLIGDSISGLLRLGPELGDFVQVESLHKLLLLLG